MPPVIPLPQPRDYELAPAGSHLGACYSVIGMGSQPYSYAGESGVRWQIRLAFELLDAFKGNGWPFSVSRIYSFSLHPNAAFRSHLENWLGRSLGEPEIRNFDLAGQLDAVAVLSIIHATGANGRQYANLGQLLQPPAGAPQRIELVNPPEALSPSAFDAGVYNALPEWLRNKLAAAPEYQEALKGGATLAGRLRQRLAAPAAPSTREVLDDEIPF